MAPGAYPPGAFSYPEITFSLAALAVDDVVWLAN
jgi:hypothetical protein